MELVHYQRTAQFVQQEFGSQNGFEGNIFWDLLTASDKDVMLTKLKHIIPDHQVNLEAIISDVNLSEKGKNDKAIDELTKAKKYNEKLEASRDLLLESIWSQRKYCGGNLLESIALVILTPEITDDKVSRTRALYETNYTCHPLIRVRKCVYKDEDSRDCCMVFIDENARVYCNWNDYIENNTLPPGVMVVPRKGVYNFDDDDRVFLDCVDSPACSTTTKVLKVADTGASAVAIGASVATVSALLLPVAAPILLGSAIASGAVGLYSIARSTTQLVDRGTHEQSINVTDREARSSWIGIAGGVLGLGAGGATQVLAKSAAGGRAIPNVAQIAVNGMNISSIVVNGIGIGNGIVDIILKYQDDESISTLDILQLSASLVLFTHSVYNFRYASTIVNASQNGKINEFRSELSNRQRKMFNKMVKETIRIKGESQGKVDIIRGLKNIPDKQYFNDIYKINKNLHEKNIRPSFGPNGNVLLNNDVAVDANVLRQSVQHNIGENVVGNVRAPIPPTQAETPSTSTSIYSRNLPFNDSVAYRIGEIVARTVTNSLVLSESDLTNCLAHLFEQLATNVVDYMIELARAFVNNYVDRLEGYLGRVLPFEQILWDVFNFSLRFSGNNVANLDEQFLALNGQRIIKLLKNHYESFAMPINGEKTKCKHCRGYYSITTIN